MNAGKGHALAMVYIPLQERACRTGKTDDADGIYTIGIIAEWWLHSLI